MLFVPKIDQVCTEVQPRENHFLIAKLISKERPSFWANALLNRHNKKPTKKDSYS